MQLRGELAARDGEIAAREADLVAARSLTVAPRSRSRGRHFSAPAVACTARSATRPCWRARCASRCGSRADW